MKVKCYFCQMVQDDFNKVYVGETKQDVFVKNKYLRYGQFKDGHDHKYFDTSRKTLSQEMTICIVEALMFIFY